MKTIDMVQFVQEMNRGNVPVYTANPGEEIRFSCLDCYSKSDRYQGEPFPGGPNPSTGPVYVQGAEPGDTLVAEILAIHLPSKGTMRVYPGRGGLGNVVDHVDERRIDILDGQALVGGVAVPLAPMVGVIGVAPETGTIDNDTPFTHGGNMDDRRIGVGAKVYLPVKVPGALFALGDVHAQMGDGEVAICGLEVSADVDVRLSLIKGRQEEWPIVEREGSFSVNCSAKTLDEAAELARYQMHAFIKKRTELSSNSIVMLLSLVGDLSICQIVDPLVTVRMCLREGVLPLRF